MYGTMISYKKIDLLHLSVNCENELLLNDIKINIKSPVMSISRENNYVVCIVNKEANNHNLFLNLCGYISRLFNIKRVKCNFIKENSVCVNITSSSRFYDENKKEISAIKDNNKGIISFYSQNGELLLHQFLKIV